VGYRTPKRGELVHHQTPIEKQQSTFIVTVKLPSFFFPPYELVQLGIFFRALKRRMADTQKTMSI
jgi:hypothetical protein